MQNGRTFTIRTSEFGSDAVDFIRGRSVFVKIKGEKWLLEGVQGEDAKKVKIDIT